MKGVVLAGGLGTRLYPLTFAANKHLLPVFDKPMVFYPIQTLVEAGIKDIMVVTSGPHSGDFIQILKDGKELGIKHLEYAYQENPTGGIADALRVSEDFADGHPITVILADNTTDANVKKEVKNFRKGALVFLKQVADPERFGVPVFSPKNHAKIIRIDEKPKKALSNFAVTGLYIYDKQVFNFIKKIKPSGRRQLEITDVNNCYIKKGQLAWSELNGFWTDAGTFESLFRANSYWAQKKLGKKVLNSWVAGNS